MSPSEAAAVLGSEAEARVRPKGVATSPKAGIEEVHRERVVHARGAGAHGFFELGQSLGRHTTAAFLQHRGARTPVFVRFSNRSGASGTADLRRDVRGFAVRFYTRQGNFDLAGTSVPVSLVQDAASFLELIRALRTPHPGFQRALSTQEGFWDFVAGTPESTHHVLWTMSDRGLPRSYRMMEGYGVHSYRLVDEGGASTFVKFHLRPKLGLQAVLWDEAVKINGADQDYHRRDLWRAIADGEYPEWEVGVQLFDEEQARTLAFDALDPTKLIPEEVVPVTPVGRLVLDRNPEDPKAETEPVAYCPANVVPGVELSSDPLLQGRAKAYKEAQAVRLGTSAQEELSINASRCPAHPPSSSPADPSSFESPQSGIRSFAPERESASAPARSASFADHYSQARQFWISQTAPEQDHLVMALVFELGNVSSLAVRERVLGHLLRVDSALGERVATGLGLSSIPEPAPTTCPARADLPPSRALSLITSSKATLEGRVVACLVTDGVSGSLIDNLDQSMKKEGARLFFVAPKIGGVVRSDTKRLPADAALAAAPSVLFDAVILAFGQGNGSALVGESAAVSFVRDAYAHLKVIGFTDSAQPLLDLAGVGAKRDAGTVNLSSAATIERFLRAARQHRIWAREGSVRTIP